MVTIEFDRPRQLHYDLGVLRDLEAQMGGEPFGAIIAQLGNLGINALVLCLWAGLKHEDRAVTPKLVERRLDTYLKAGGQLRPLVDGINAALEDSGLFKAPADEPIEAADPLAPAPRP